MPVIRTEGTVNLGDGDDDVIGQRSTFLHQIIYGGGGNDTLAFSLNGTFGSLYGEAGDDYLLSGLGRSNLSGDDGNDVLVGTASDLDTGDFGPTISGGKGNDLCIGTAGEDSIYGEGDGVSSGRDALYGGSGDDSIHGGDGNDSGTISTRLGVFSAGLYGGDGNDRLNGGEGNDFIDGGSGNDSIHGGDGTDTGADTLYGGAGNDFIAGEDGNDRVYGGTGNDTLGDSRGNNLLVGGPGADVLNGGSGAGTSTASYLSSALSVSVNLTAANGNLFGVGRGGDATGDKLYYIDNVQGSNSGDTLTGSGLANTLSGFGGADTLTGRSGKDALYGGTGGDRFDFNALGESPRGAGRDVIADFKRGQHDKIDLSTIDAKTGAPGNNAFKFIGTQAFHDVKGELRCSGGIVQADVTGDGKADFEIKVNLATLLKSDFIL